MSLRSSKHEDGSLVHTNPKRKRGANLFCAAPSLALRVGITTGVEDRTAQLFSRA